MTVAEDIVRRHNFVRVLHAIMGGILALSLIIGGIYLTQRQIGNEVSSDVTEVKARIYEAEMNAKSTYPGIALIVCGTEIACCLILKRYHANTQHKDQNNPGFTEVEN